MTHSKCACVPYYSYCVLLQKKTYYFSAHGHQNDKLKVMYSLWLNNIIDSVYIIYKFIKHREHSY